ncbi:MAG: hypothetical protein ACO1OO_03005 [Flavisolibacter sp.]
MGKDHRGQPSGTNRQESPTGVPSQPAAADNKQNEQLTEKYTKNNKDLADNVRENNPNRNTDKTEATNAGGYKN